MSLAFARFRRELAALTGVALDSDKRYLAESRLAPLMRAHSLSDLAELSRRLETRDDPALIDAMIDAMTTHETSFFRDRETFAALRERVLPDLLAARASQRRLRFWCAACATGQEVYSLAMTLDQEAAALRGWSVEILATDVSQSAVETAREGVYSQFEAQRGLPVIQLLRYFHRDGDRWRVNEHLRARIDFRPFNLMDDLRELGAFDVVLCRNVLLYFEPATKQDVLTRLARATAAEGYLVLGAGETLGEAGALFRPTQGLGVFRRAPRGRGHLRLA